jgi:uncharacterized protein
MLGSLDRKSEGTITLCFLRTCRRSFMKQLGALWVLSTFDKPDLLALSMPPPGRGDAGKAVKNRTPLAERAYFFLPLGSIHPSGWLRNQLEIQANGLGGHLDEVWPDVGPNSGWLGETGESWERGPYFLDGLVPLAWQLDDPRLKAKAQKFIDWTLDHQASSGMIGPASNDDWWPRIVMLKVLTQYQEATDDPRVIPVMDKYLRYQYAELPSRPLRDWGKFRWQDELLSVVWLYNRTASAYLLDLARLLRAQGHDWEAEYENFQYTERCTAEFLKLDQGNGLKDLALSTHGVNNAQGVKAGPVWSLVSGLDADRFAALKMTAELEKYHGLPNGMFSCDEHLAGRNPSQGSELCSVVEYMYSLEQSISISGDASLGDRLERLAFNALPGAFTDDMWAHQYNQEPNQVECSLHRKPWTTDGPESNLYGLAPNFGCCTANFHQGWPKFTASLWMQPSSGGLAAMAYAPCSAIMSVVDSQVGVVTETDYPFRGHVRIGVNPSSPMSFPLSLRIPGWADGTHVYVNGEPQSEPKSCSFFRIERRWKFGDEVVIEMPMAPRVASSYLNSAVIERGPLVFSYPIGTDWLKLVDRGLASDWQVYPATRWNYALAIDSGTAPSTFATEERPLTSDVFSLAKASVRLQTPAVFVPTWRADDGAADPVPASPLADIQGASIEEITLVPYAAAKLRITAFPRYEAAANTADARDPDGGQSKS